MGKTAQAKPENEVNAYLFYAQRLLQLSSSPTLKSHQADKMAITAGVCLSMKQAWQAWLRELSAYVGKDIPDYASILLAENSFHPEVQALIELIKQPNNWLSQLILFFEPRLNSPSVMQNEDDLQVDASAVRINLIQVAVDAELSEEQKLTQVIADFKAYIHAVRARQSEW